VNMLNLGQPEKAPPLRRQDEATDNLEGVISLLIRRVLSKTNGKVKGA